MTKRSFRTNLLGATMLLGCAAMPAMAHAQAAPAGDAGADAGADANSGPDANYIVVTATRRATTLQDAPINISAVSPQELARQRIDDIKSLSAFTPGMTVSDTGPGSSGKIVLRGINSGDSSVEGANANSAVGVYLGEVPLYLDLKLLDIDHVEVLQGPQGTLYGLGTLAGAVRYMPKRPDTDHYTVDLHGRWFGESHSSQAGVNADGTVNIPIVKDHIALRSTVGYYDNPGFIDYNYLLREPGVSNPQPVRGTDASDASFGSASQRAANFYSKKDVNYEHTFTTRNQLLLQASPDFKLYLTYAHQITKTGGRQANGAGVLGTGNYEAPWRYLEPTSRKSDLYSAEFNVNLFDVAQLVATTAFTNQTIITQRDNTDLLLDLDYGYEAFPNFSSYNRSTAKYRQFNEEVRLVSTHGGPFSWVIGGFYNNQRYGSQYREYVPGYPEFAGIYRPDNLEYMSFVNTRTKEKAVYGEGTFHITKDWQVTGGLRYFKYDAFAEGGTDTPLFSSYTPYPLVVFAPQRIKSGATGDDGFVWKANTSYKFSPDLMAYFTYSTGYRTGNVNRVAPCVLPLDPDVQNVCALPNELSFGPDKTRNRELGLRGALFDKKLQFTLSGFIVTWSGVQVPSQTVNGAVGITVNGSTAVSKGIDFSSHLKITPRLTIDGTYSYNDAHLTADAPGIVVSSGVNYDAYAGDRLPGSTKHAGSLGATYTYPLGDGKDIEASWATTYTGNIYSRVGLRGNGEVIPAYTTHRASVTYHSDMFDIGVYADNIFDKYAVTAVENDRSSYNRTRTGVVERYYAYGVLTPRRVGLEMTFHYK
ncbi:TonB-dependent receptor [Novosphingobium sp. SG916]|uniref:TonB-dependent receptor n=1 Tax=unclassified Novosphingobium TaxID=2644732 RepID=UPI0017C70C94|nr:outer membrane receptor protein involved in Fe transport [Novosphingobium sp. SG919]NMN87704.1 outer membrane receptor protein involved in Fe transport [Novosphingobium sp. SG916]